MSTLISVNDLNNLQHTTDTVRLLDVRWSLPVPDGRPEYLAGHIPGAVYVDLDTELAQHGQPSDGRHPLPAETEFGETVRRWGINEGDTVVVYDAGNSLAAGRAWWLLRYAGIDARILDGGFSAWRNAGLPVSTSPAEPTWGNVQVRFGRTPVITTEQVASWPESGILLDARASERYRGESEPIDPRAGHIPGAINAPTTENLADDGSFLTPAALQQRFADLGVTGDQPVAVYCGSGVTAAHQIAALATIGIEATLYPGSWSAWSNTSDRPVAIGPTPREES